MTDCELNALAAEIHAANSHWWRDLETGERLDRNKGEMLMLVVSELAETMEGERKDLMDSHLPHRKMAEVELADVKIRVLDFAGGFQYPLYQRRYKLRGATKAEQLLEIVHEICSVKTELEFNLDPDGENIGDILSDVLAATDEYARLHGYDVDGAMAEKRAYNATRHDHSREARLAANGKKF